MSVLIQGLEEIADEESLAVVKVWAILESRLAPVRNSHVMTIMEFRKSERVE